MFYINYEGCKVRCQSTRRGWIQHFILTMRDEKIGNDLTNFDNIGFYINYGGCKGDRP